MAVWGEEDTRQILKFDSGRRGFTRAALFLVVLAALLALFGVLFLRGTFNW
jgi:hypothetical protein